VPDGIDPTVRQASQPAPATSGTLDIRVPGNRFDDARRALEAVGSRIVHEDLSGNDVGGQLVDLNARIDNLQAEETALRGLEAKAGSTADILQLQPQLLQVRTEIEELKSQQASLTNQVALASLHVSLTEPVAAGTSPSGAPAHQSALAHSWHVAVHGLAAVTGGMLIVLGYALPVAALGVLVWLGLRPWSRRRRSAPGVVAG
jgi:hypothetical protein